MISGRLLKNIDFRKNLVLIGESGSGKTEAALNFSAALAKSGREVRLFDMDQTKPLIRARDAEKKLAEQYVTIHYQEQIMDLPIVAPAVRETMMRKETCVVMDVGGNDYGAHMIGQFYDIINGQETSVIYLINPFRVWSREKKEIEASIQRILTACRIKTVYTAFNPTIGEETTAEDVILGTGRLKEKMGVQPAFVMAEKRIAAVVETELSEPVFEIQRYLKHPWHRE